MIGSTPVTWRVPSSYTAAQLVQAVQVAKARLAAGVCDRFNTSDWASDPMTVTEYLAWFRKCLHEKASRGQVRHGRKLSGIYQLELSRDAQRLRGLGSGNRLVTPEVRARVGDHIHRHVDGAVTVCQCPESKCV